ncbi:MoaD/ThiS family protein [Eubacteriaceae bacterium ES3]|nr:MoaD/ThiS family protein [Eubacteriaceae bacterium ES3]
MARVKYLGRLKQLTKGEQAVIDAGTIGGMLKVIRQQHGKEAYLMAKKSHLVVNGENAGLYGGFRMKLKDSDLVMIVPVCCGG